MSDQLLGPAESWAFDCDRYEEHLRCLQGIANSINADKSLTGDIDKYLLPYKRSDNTFVGQVLQRAASWTHWFINGTPDEKIQWDETFVHLKHSKGDEQFGSLLKDMAEPSRKSNSIFPNNYAFQCHHRTSLKNTVS
jgi:hypothetical protein